MPYHLATPVGILAKGNPALLMDLSDQELIELAASEVGVRKKAIAEEILRRRHQQRIEKWLGPKAAIAGLVSAVVTALVILRRWFSRR